MLLSLNPCIVQGSPELCPQSHKEAWIDPERLKARAPKCWECISRSWLFIFWWCFFCFFVFWFFLVVSMFLYIFQIFNSCSPCVISEPVRPLYEDKSHNHELEVQVNGRTEWWGHTGFLSCLSPCLDYHLWATGAGQRARGVLARLHVPAIQDVKLEGTQLSRGRDAPPASQPPRASGRSALLRRQLPSGPSWLFPGGVPPLSTVPSPSQGEQEGNFEWPPSNFQTVNCTPTFCLETFPVCEHSLSCYQLSSYPELIHPRPG